MAVELTFAADISGAGSTIVLVGGMGGGPPAAWVARWAA